jgi:broad specificity phosphatase PhoE
MNVYFLRHCEADYKKDNQGHFLNIPLTIRGQEHAKSLAKKLNNKSFNLILCSDALRTQQTIAPYLVKYNTKNISIIYDKRLREVEDILTGYGQEHLIRESVKKQKERLDSFLKDLLKMKINGVLIVTHFNVIDYTSKKIGKHIAKPPYGSLNKISI